MRITKLKAVFLMFLVVSMSHSLFAVDDLELMADKKDISFKLTGKVATRYIHMPKDEVDDVHKFQSYLTLKMVLDWDGAFQIVGIASSGQGYADVWDTFEDLNVSDDDYNPTLKMRNLYLQKQLAEHTVQLGALAVEKGISDGTSVSDLGWIDGGRVKLRSLYGDIHITAGSLKDLEKPNFFERDFDFNYMEVKVSRRFFEKICVEAAVEHLDDINYMKGAVTYDVAIAAERIVKFLGEAMADDQGGFKLIGGVEGDIVEVFTGKKSGIKVNLSYQYMDDDMTDNARPATTFWTQPGSTVLIRASGNIKKDWGLTWYTQFRINEDSDRSYYIVGVSKAMDFNKGYSKIKGKLINRD